MTDIPTPEESGSDGTTSNQFSTLSVSVTASLSIIGAFLIALPIAKD